jgi:predicted nucleic acid-binding protein
LIYIDSSVVLAQLLTEAHRPAAAFWQQVSVSSRLLEYEVWNRVWARGLGRSLRNEIHAVLRKIDMVGLGPLALRRAQVAVRTLDALHLAIIDFLRGSGEAIELASYDKRLIAAARALAIPIVTL